MTKEEFFKIVKEFSLTTSFSCGVYYMDKRIGYYDVITTQYHFIPNDIAKHSIHFAVNFREYLKYRTLKIKNEIIKNNLSKIQEDFK